MTCSRRMESLYRYLNPVPPFLKSRPCTDYLGRECCRPDVTCFPPRCFSSSRRAARDSDSSPTFTCQTRGYDIIYQDLRAQQRARFSVGRRSSSRVRRAYRAEWRHLGRGLFSHHSRRVRARSCHTAIILWPTLCLGPARHAETVAVRCTNSKRAAGTQTGNTCLALEVPSLDTGSLFRSPFGLVHGLSNESPSNIACISRFSDCGNNRRGTAAHVRASPPPLRISGLGGPAKAGASGLPQIMWAKR